MGGILAMDESNGTCGKRLDSIDVENTEANRREYRELLLSTPGLGEYIGGAILFEETLYQSGSTGTPFVDTLNSQGIIPGIKVDKGLVPMSNSNGESWCQGLDGLAERCAEYYKQGAPLPSGAPWSTSPRGPPTRRSSTAPTASPATPLSARGTASSPSSSPRSCSTASTTSTPPWRSPPAPGPRSSSAWLTRTLCSRASSSSLHGDPGRRLWHQARP